MIYICAQPSKLVPSTKDFVARGLNGFTIGRIGDINLFGKPTEHQLAYDGYRSNIECFLAATALGQKVATRVEHCPFPSTYKATVPLPLPQVVFKLQGTPTNTEIQNIEKKLAKEGIEKLQIKTTNTYVLKNPSATSIQNLLRICPSTCAFLEGYSQLNGASALLPIYDYVDAFLATHTYSYKKSDFDVDPSKACQVEALGEIRYESGFYREGYSKEIKASPWGKPVTRRLKIDETEPSDLTPYMSSSLPMSAVLIAKPSKVPSSKSFGTPSEVPNKAGILFPYFDGMLSHDTKYIRNMITSVFFRNLGDSQTSPKQAYLKLKEKMGTATTTPQGDILSHVLKGIELALECQSQLFLLLDGQNYFGFTILGEEFTVFAHGSWHEPLPSDKLRAELDTLLTHDQVLERLVTAISRCNFRGEEKMVSKASIEKPGDLLDVLAEIDTKASEDTQVELVTELLKSLTFAGTYRRINAENIEWAIRAIVEDDVTALEKEKIYIPYKDWAGVEEMAFQVLACFGTQSFSFFEPRGDDVRIPRDSGDSPYYEVDENGKVAKDKRLVVYEKNLRQCVKDWEWFIENGKIRMALKERAAGSRGVMFTGDGLVRVWKAMQMAVPLFRGDKGKGKRAAEGTSEGPSKKKAKEDGPSSSIADVLSSW